MSHQMVEKDLLGNEKWSTINADLTDPLPGRLTVVTVDSKMHYLYAGTDNGWLLLWDISEPDSINLLESVSAS